MQIFDILYISNISNHNYNENNVTCALVASAYVCVPSADVACAAKYSRGYPAVLGSIYHECVLFIIN
jgi:hypothetical protein